MARFGWAEIAEYIHQKFGDFALQDFEERTIQAENEIALMPNSGSIAWEDTTENVTYRYKHIYRRSKMLYFVENDTIVIADFWDVRKDK